MFEKLFRSFRSPFRDNRDDITLEDEIALYRHRAELAEAEERWADSLVFLAKILRLNPYDLKARMTVARTYHYRLKEPTKALLTYEKVIAAAGYDDSNSYSVAAREGIRELALVLEAPSLPLAELLEDETDEAAPASADAAG
jgi:tetratricopeptide (TPR) repeat protein